ncbi:hypothetical protein T12_10300 [Trichinella patagoniensis]|uniref:Uncharacterized protein n=1 Tax=Trichinella patagoniensis TaxID=990121 RepID=A0A0V0ZR13_9BILA|nr:hypothetical protein T12_10300 [Trichinella patagoniensis]
MENPQSTVRSMIMRSLDEVKFLETNEIPLLHCCGKTTYVPWAYKSFQIKFYLLFTNKQALVIDVHGSCLFRSFFEYLLFLICD